MVPRGVTILIRTTMSSIFPYVFFFIPEERVATQPPRLLNSCESGSWPEVYPFSSNCKGIWSIVPPNDWATFQSTTMPPFPPKFYGRESARLWLTFRSRSCPMIPASTWAVRFSSSSQRILSISIMSSDMIGRVSSSGHSSAPETLVPPEGCQKIQFHARKWLEL